MSAARYAAPSVIAARSEAESQDPSPTRQSCDCARDDRHGRPARDNRRLMTNADLPSSCDVLVVGAGPAGAACALWLARAGADVVLADQHDYPRDKVCGDALIPDAHHALQRLGVYDEVMAAAQASQHVACIAPRGGRID